MQDQIDENLSLQEKQLQQNQKYEDQIQHQTHHYKQQLVNSKMKQDIIVSKIKVVTGHQIKMLRDELSQLKEFALMQSKRSI